MSRIATHLNRLADALKAQKVILKRSQLLEVAAGALGFRNSNELTAAAKAGELDPPAAKPIGRITIGGHELIALEDPIAHLPFAAKATAGEIIIAPSGGLVSVPALSAALPVLGAAMPSAASVWIASCTDSSNNELINLSGPSVADVTAQLAQCLQDLDPSFSRVATLIAFDFEENENNEKNQAIIDAYYENHSGQYKIEEIVTASSAKSPQTHKPLVLYRVILKEHINDKSAFLFDCQADDDEHAVEQARDAYPQNEIVAKFVISPEDYQRGPNAAQMAFIDVFPHAELSGNWPQLFAMINAGLGSCESHDIEADLLSQIDGLQDDLDIVRKAIAAKFTQPTPFGSQLSVVPYQVSYLDPAKGNSLMHFDCMAKSEDDAIEQIKKAHPHGNIIRTAKIAPLDVRRHALADAEFENYDFGDGEVTSADGWEYLQPGAQMSRKIYISEDDSRDDGSTTATFVVNFASTDSAHVTEAYAISELGDIYGERGANISK